MEGVGIVCVGAGAGMFLFLAYRYSCGSRIRLSRGVPFFAIAGAATLFFSVVWFPRPFAFLCPYQPVGTWKTTDLDGHECEVDVSIKALNYTTPPGELPRLKLAMRSCRGSDTITFDTEWRFGLEDLRPVDGGVDAMTGLGGFCPYTWRFLIQDGRWKPQPEALYNIGEQDWTWVFKGHADDELLPLLNLIHNSPRSEGTLFNPLLLIRAVNGLQATGKDKAGRAIDAYRKLGALPELRRDFRDYEDQQMDEKRLWPILGLLYGEDNGSIVLQDDVPFRVGTDQPLAPGEGTFRERPLTPTRSPFDAAEALIASGKDPEALQLQAILAVHNVYGYDLSRYPPGWDFRPPTSSEWARDRDAVRALKIRWDAMTQNFVRGR